MCDLGLTIRPNKIPIRLSIPISRHLVYHFYTYNDTFPILYVNKVLGSPNQTAQSNQARLHQGGGKLVLCSTVSFTDRRAAFFRCTTSLRVIRGVPAGQLVVRNSSAILLRSSNDNLEHVLRRPNRFAVGHAFVSPAIVRIAFAHSCGMREKLEWLPRYTENKIKKTKYIEERLDIKI